MPVRARVCPRVSVRVLPSPALDDFSSVKNCLPKFDDPCLRPTRPSHACSCPAASFPAVLSAAATFLIDEVTPRAQHSRRDPRVIDRWPPRLAPGSSAFWGGVSQLDRQGLRPFRSLYLLNNQQAVWSETLPRTFTAHNHHAHMLSHTSAHVSPRTQALQTRRADRAEWLDRARNEHNHAAGWADAGRLERPLTALRASRAAGAPRHLRPMRRRSEAGLGRRAAGTEACA